MREESTVGSIIEEKSQIYSIQYNNYVIVF